MTRLDFQKFICFTHVVKVLNSMISFTISRMPRSRQMRDSILHRDRQGGTIPFAEEFLNQLHVGGFTPTQELFESYVALVNTKVTLTTIPSKTGFARYMARTKATYRSQEAGLRGYSLKFHQM